MIKHIVMWKIRDEVDGKPKSEVCREIKTLLEALPEKIPLIKHYEVGINIIPSSAAETSRPMPFIRNMSGLQKSLEKRN